MAAAPFGVSFPSLSSAPQCKKEDVGDLIYRLASHQTDMVQFCNAQKDHVQRCMTKMDLLRCEVQELKAPHREQDLHRRDPASPSEQAGLVEARLRKVLESLVRSVEQKFDDKVVMQERMIKDVVSRLEQMSSHNVAEDLLRNNVAEELAKRVGKAELQANKFSDALERAERRVDALRQRLEEFVERAFADERSGLREMCSSFQEEFQRSQDALQAEHARTIQKLARVPQKLDAQDARLEQLEQTHELQAEHARAVQKLARVPHKLDAQDARLEQLERTLVGREELDEVTGSIASLQEKLLRKFEQEGVQWTQLSTSVETLGRQVNEVVAPGQELLGKHFGRLDAQFKAIQQMLGHQVNTVGVPSQDYIGKELGRLDSQQLRETQEAGAMQQPWQAHHWRGGGGHAAAGRPINGEVIQQMLGHQVNAVGVPSQDYIGIGKELSRLDIQQLKEAQEAGATQQAWQVHQWRGSDHAPVLPSMLPPSPKRPASASRQRGHLPSTHDRLGVGTGHQVNAVGVPSQDYIGKELGRLDIQQLKETQEAGATQQPWQTHHWRGFPPEYVGGSTYHRNLGGLP